MTEKVAEYFTNLLVGLHLSKEFIVIFLSAFPILEVRGGMVVASLLNMNPYEALLLGIIGNLLPIPFLIFLLKPIFNWMRKWKRFSKLITYLENKAYRKKDKIEKYQFWGILLLVAIPLPGTGAWTGCLVSSVFDVDKKISIPACSLGVLIASFIMWIISFGILGRFF